MEAKYFYFYLISISKLRFVAILPPFEVFLVPMAQPTLLYCVTPLSLCRSSQEILLLFSYNPQMSNIV